MELFHITNLNFAYPLNQECALKAIDLSVEQGEFVVLCGQSGCGKTTLIKQLKPSLTPHGRKEGEILFSNEPLETLTQREETEKIGYVLQNPENQIVTDKVWHELAFGLESLGYDQDKIRLKVAEMASFFGIQHWFYKNVSELSGGQKQLLNLASVMAMSPEVLILDEPTAQLDPIAAVDFLETLKKINTEIGTTIIITEHRLEEVFKLADRVIIMDQGRIWGDGTPRQVCKHLIAGQHPMMEAMPTPMQIAGKIGLDSYPLTIKEGRKVLEQYVKEKHIQSTTKKLKEETDEGSTLKKSKNNYVLQAKEIFFRYEKHGEDVLKQFTLNLCEGECYALVGGNGVGKSTTLSVLSGLEKPYRGKIKKSKCVVMLPQTPQTLFVKKTVYLDLVDGLDAQKLTKEQQEERLNRVIEQLEIGEFLEMHPYDLSGGEQQKVALAKVLLREPEILLLDEPTKGLDAHFKIKFAGLLNKLKQQGVTVLMVSHDIEFCATYADRCGLFFDGQIISQATTKRFFLQNNFYTTSASRMTRKILQDAVTVEDVVKLCVINNR